LVIGSRCFLCGKHAPGSLTISIPKAMVKALGFSPDEKVRVMLTDRGISIVKKR
jgi:antitoxin component of MazEF toxin-antitoxin module